MNNYQTEDIQQTDNMNINQISGFIVKDQFGLQTYNGIYSMQVPKRSYLS